MGIVILHNTPNVCTGVLPVTVVLHFKNVLIIRLALQLKQCHTQGLSLRPAHRTTEFKVHLE